MKLINYFVGARPTLFFILHLLLSLDAQASNICEVFDYTIFGEIDRVFQNCSGHGTCIEENENNPCLCEKGWTGLSDFINTDGTDCQINEAAIKSLWGLVLVLAIWGQLKGYKAFVHRVKQFQRSRKEHKLRGKPYHIRKQRVFLAVVCFQFICIPFTVLFAVLRIAKDDERVGVTFGVTLLFGLAKVGFYLANYYYNPALLEMTLREGKSYLNGVKVNRLQRAVRIAQKVQCGTSILLGFLPFITYANDGILDDTAKAVYVIYFIGMILTISGMGAQSYVVMVRVDDMLDKSFQVSQDDRIKIFQEKIRATQKAGQRQAIIQVMFYVSFLFNPFQWNLHDYFLPISWISFIVIGKQMTNAIVKDNEGGQSSSKKAGGLISRLASKKNESKQNNEEIATSVAPITSITSFHNKNGSVMPDSETSFI